jgi:hypothetical protein
MIFILEPFVTLESETGPEVGVEGMSAITTERYSQDDAENPP